MSRLVAQLFTVALLAGAAACDDDPAGPFPEDGPAELELARGSVNLGEIDLAAPATVTWMLRNIGAGAAQIQRIDTTSDELVVIADTCTGELPAYADCEVTVAVRPARAGAFTGELVIVTSAGELVARVEAIGRAQVTVAVDGAVRVTSEPTGIDCGGGATACSAAFTVPSIVLTASGEATIRWSGGCAGYGPCKLALTGPLAVTATALAPLVVIIDETPVRNDFAAAVAIDAADRMIVTGEGAGPLTGDVWTGAIAPDGRLAWRELYDYGAEGHDTGHAVAVAADGTIIVAGQWYSSSWTRWNMFLRAFDGSGAVLWSRASEDIRDDAYRGLAIDDATGAIYAVGLRADPDLAEGVPALYAHGVIQRLDATGAVVWERAWQGTADGDDVAHGVALAPGGGVLVAGRTMIAGHRADAWIAAYAADGTRAWSRLRGAEGDDEALAIAAAPDGTFAVVGSHAGVGWIARYSADGAVLDEIWTPDVARWQGVAVTPAGELAVTGDAHTRLYSPALEPVWSESYRAFEAADLAIDHAGKVVVTGRIGDDIAVIKYFQ